MDARLRMGLDRMLYWQGQQLRSRDFRDQSEREAQLRWWHNRALHNAFGVRYGLAVAASFEGGALAGVEIGCGLAYDCFGRELILQSPRAVRLPRVDLNRAGRVTLLARYKEASGTSSSCACGPALEEPDFAWKPSNRVGIKDGVPLAEVSYESFEVLDSLPEGLSFDRPLKRRIRYEARRKRLAFKGVMSVEERDELLKLSEDEKYQEAITKLFEASQGVPVLDAAFRVTPARPIARPRIESGSTVPGGTPWEVWSERILGFSRNDAHVPVGMQVSVDTSAAGFTEVPCYFAWLQGEMWTAANVLFFPAPFDHVDSEAINGFRFRLWMPQIAALLGSRLRFANENFETEFINFARQQKIHVCWLGIQHGHTAADFPYQTDQDAGCQTEDEG